MKLRAITLMTALLLALPALGGPPCTGPDQDSDGHVDMCDNCLTDPNVSQTDCDSDGCGNVCDADFDQSGLVAIADFSRFAILFGGAPGPSGTTSGTTACP